MEEILNHIFSLSVVFFLEPSYEWNIFVHWLMHVVKEEFTYNNKGMYELRKI